MDLVVVMYAIFVYWLEGCVCGMYRFFLKGAYGALKFFPRIFNGGVFVRYQISMDKDFNTLDGRFLPHELRNILPIKKRGQRRLPAPLP
jgi:hypothetical protein